MKLQQLPSGSYRIEKMIKGRRYSIIFDHKPSQEEIALAMAEKIEDYKTSANGTFESIAKEYIQSRNNVASPSTIRTYNTKLNQISDEFKSKMLYSINNGDVQTEINKFAVGHAPKTVKTLHGFIASVLGAYRPNLRLKTKLPQAIKKEEYDPSTQDIERILAEVKGTGYSVAFQLGIMGCRRGEICACSIDDLKGNELWIHRDVVYNEGEWIAKENPKTDASNRTILLPDSLVKEIQEQGFIYNGHPNALNKAIHRIQDKLGIPNFKFHALRHYFASYAHALGMADADIMAMGGWETDAVMKRVYRKSMQESQKKANALFNKSIWG